MGVEGQAHRAGSLKQSNKSHKTGRHRSKGQINNEGKGKQCTTMHVAEIYLHKNALFS